MSTSRFDRFLPFAGVLAGAAFLAVNVLTWGSPDGTDPAEVTAWFDGHQTQAVVAAALLGYVAVLLAFFAVAARQAVRSGEPGESTYSSAVFAGGIMVASACGLWSYLYLAQISAVGGDSPAAVVETLAHLTSFAWLPWLIGSVVLFVALGLGGLRTASLPRWLAYVTLALAALGATGIGGIAVYVLMPFWLMLTSAVLLQRLGRQPAAGITADASSVPSRSVPV